MKFKKFLAVMLVLAMTVSMLTACGKKADPGKDNTGKDTTSPTGTADTSKDTTTSDPNTAGYGDRSLYPGTPDANAITVNLASEPADMCTITTTDNLSFNVIRHLIENLVELDANDQVVPGVAKTWDVSADGLTYTFHLREGMKWTNGEPVTAKDFAFSWTALLDPSYAAQYAYFGYVIKNGMKFNKGEVTADQLGVKAIDDYTFEVTLENPTPYFLSMCAFGVLAPMNEKAYKEFGKAYATDADKIVTNGPFKMSSWEHENKIVITKNPDFYDASKINLDTINFVMINDTNAVMNSLKAGELDIGGLVGDQTKALKGEGFPVFNYDDGAVAYLEFNLNDPFLKNVNLRTALTYAVDKQAYVDSIMKNSSLPATGFTAPGINGQTDKFAKEIGQTVPVLDVAKANEYLDKALTELGTTKDKIKITMISDDGDVAVKTASFIQEQIKKNLGIKIDVESMPFKSRLARMTNKDFSMVAALWGPDYNDPMTYLDMFETGNGNNHTSYTNAAYDELLKKVRVTVDPKERFGYLMDLEKQLMTDLPIGPLYWRVRDYFISGKIESGVVRTAFQDMNYRYVKLAK